MHENDLEDLIARFVSAIEIAEATAQTLQAATAPLIRVSARIETLEPPMTQNQARIEELADRLPVLTAELTSAASHLRNSLRPPVARIWATASALVLVTSLLLVGSLTALRPQWCLTEPLQDQLRIGRLLADRLSRLPKDRQAELTAILHELSSPTSSSSNSELSVNVKSRSESVSPDAR